MDHPIKIALVSPYDHASHGGVRNHIVNLASQFRNWGDTVRIIAPCSSSKRIQDEDFIPMGRPVPVPSGGSIARISLSVWLRPRIKSLLQQERFDVIHLHEPMAGFVTLNALRVADSIKSVYIGTFHTYRGTRIYSIRGVRPSMMPSFRRLHGHIAVSPPAQQFINRYFPAKYKIIPNGIYVDDFSNATPFPHLLDGKINLLFLGRLEKRKGLKYLLSAFSKLKWDWPNLRLLVVGPGKPDDDSYRMIGERNLQDVVFVGSVSDKDRARYYKSAHIYCAPATGRESFGIVLLEAMAAGVPVVASNIEGYSSVLTDRHDGLLFPPKDDQALADTIESLLKDQELYRTLKANGLNKVEQFRWDKVAGRVRDYYKVLLDQQNSAVTQ